MRKTAGGCITARLVTLLLAGNLALLLSGTLLHELHLCGSLQQAQRQTGI